MKVPNATVLSHLVNTPGPPLRKAAFVACDPSGSLKRHIEECRHSFSVLDVPDKLVLADASRSITKDATIEVMKEVDLFHFAGHSVMASGRPDESGLLLSDGLLTVSGLEQAFAHHAPSLVFLSSCESGADDSILEDAPNLSSVFLQAGARVVIGASWRVADSIAAFTARKFYENLMSDGPIAALKNAQTELMGRITSAEWASFRLQGWD